MQDTDNLPENPSQTPEVFNDSQGVKEAQVLGAKSPVPELSILRTDPEAASKAAMLLMQPNALGEINLLEARRVVAYLKAHRISAGKTFIREDDKEHTDFMLLVLEGEATVENQVVSRTQPFVMNVIGPGALIGEISLIDGLPRSANVVATTDMLVATLSRASLMRLLSEHPDIASKVLLAIAQRLSARVREGNAKLRSYSRLVEIMQDELQDQIVRSGALARIALGQVGGVVKPGSGGDDL
jgi:CRP/FNR family transcriptional regulator, cyclic AMP receptor protein